MSFHDDLTTDLPIFLDTNDFGKIATYKGNSIDVQFYTSYEGASPFESNIESKKTWIVARTIDVSDAVHGDPITIDLVIYTIEAIEPGDSGFMTLRLMV